MFKYKNLDDDEYTKKIITPVNYNYIKIFDSKNPQENYCVLIKNYLNIAKKIKNLKIYKDDVWVISFPKSGTTWTQEMVWLLNNNLDYEQSKKSILFRYLFLELEGTNCASFDTNFDDYVTNAQKPRHFKCHLPVFLLPDEIWTIKPKIIYTARNPKDVIVSFYHHYRHWHGYSGKLNDFINAFINDKLLYSLMNEHVLEYWKLSKKYENILFLFYEDRVRNLEQEVKKVAKFLEKDYSQEKIEDLCKHLTFDSMQKNPSCNNEHMTKMLKENFDFESKHEKFNFIREGKIGSYKKEMDEEEIKKVEKYMDYPDFENYGFEYKF
ncbi:hypothetical protein PVAND_008447 [Polypedilum vanderplanki]|uniref:Sulfotransferase domain-containing protein n=1 Tax=Polypedilum vanderplanki TaxID=319348 RepID=A0A9J6CA95_POLVA|nr:hypothetical protein PVAND_008447 [Polypedilum vanderplanki]